MIWSQISNLSSTTYLTTWFRFVADAATEDVGGTPPIGVWFPVSGLAVPGSAPEAGTDGATVLVVDPVSEVSTLPYCCVGGTTEAWGGTLDSWKEKYLNFLPNIFAFVENYQIWIPFMFCNWRKKLGNLKFFI